MKYNLEHFSEIMHKNWNEETEIFCPLFYFSGTISSQYPSGSAIK